MQTILGSAKVERGSFPHLAWGIQMNLRSPPHSGMQVVLLQCRTLDRAGPCQNGQIWSGQWALQSLAAQSLIKGTKSIQTCSIKRYVVHMCM